MFENIDFMTEQAQRFAEHWQQLPRKQLLPSRNDFDPADVAAMLPGVSMYQFNSKQDITIRLAGTEIVHVYGQEVTGMNYLDLWPEDLRATVGEVFTAMLSQPCGLLVAMDALSRDGVTTKSISVGFPFLNNDGQANLTLFHTSNFDMPILHDPKTDPVVSLRLTRRVLLDIGAGKPELTELA
jgi:hypothetical protein